MKKEWKKGITLAYIVMGVYLIFLCWLILFKLADSIDKIPSRRGINLIPFHYDELEGSRFQLTEILYNVLAFIPVGFYFTAFGKKKIVSGILLSFGLSFCFETLQYIFALGSSDITDILMNTVGGILGIGIYYVFEKLFKDKGILIGSVIGAVIEVLLISLIIMLILF